MVATLTLDHWGRTEGGEYQTGFDAAQSGSLSLRRLSEFFIDRSRKIIIEEESYETFQVSMRMRSGWLCVVSIQCFATAHQLIPFAEYMKAAVT